MKIIFMHELKELGYMAKFSRWDRKRKTRVVDEFVIFFSCNAFLRPTLE